MSVSQIVDVAAIVLVLCIVYTSFRKGFLRSVLELAGYVVSAVVARVLCIPVGGWLYDTLLKSNAQQLVSQYLSSLASLGDTQSLESLLSRYGIPASLLPGSVSQGTATITNGTASQALMGSVVDPIALAIGRGIAFLVLFFLCLWVCHAIARATEVFNHIPLIGGLNRLLGAAVGVAKAALVLFVLDVVVSAVLPLTSLSGQTAAAASILSHSAVYQAVDGMNPLKDVLLKR